MKTLSATGYAIRSNESFNEGRTQGTMILGLGTPKLHKEGNYAQDTYYILYVFLTVNRSTHHTYSQENNI